MYMWKLRSVEKDMHRECIETLTHALSVNEKFLVNVDYRYMFVLGTVFLYAKTHSEYFCTKKKKK